MREARREIDQVVDDLKSKTATLALDAERRVTRLIPTGQTGAARAEARAAVDAIGERLRTPGQHPSAAAVRPWRRSRSGRRPLAIACSSARSASRGSSRRSTTATRRLTSAASAAREGPRAARRQHGQRQGGRAPPPRVTVDLQPRSGSLTELNLVGCRRRSARPHGEVPRRSAHQRGRLAADHPRLRHRASLRRAIAGYLETHPLVSHFGPAPAEQGGGGATLVDLKE
jgi:hypothetical protein